MARKKHIVKQGDSIASIAYRYGLLHDSVWNDPENSELKRKRKDPNVLLPGDIVYVRDKELKEVSVATGKRHRFRVKGMTEKLVIQFTRNDEPRAEEPYILEIDGKLLNGQTDEDGKVEISVSASAKKGKISFPEAGDEYDLEVGHLDPISEVSGIQGRLRNLGFFNYPIDGKMSDEFDQAIRNFQKSQNVQPTGRLDEATRNMIQQAYGG